MAEAATIGRALAHDSASRHVTGEAVYVDDMPEPARCLEIYTAWAQCAHGRIKELDLAVRAAPGVVAVLTNDDIPGVNDISPVGRDDEPVRHRYRPVLGQALFAVAAETVHAARAAALARVAYEELPPQLDVDEARAREDHVWPPGRMQRGDAAAALAASPCRIDGRIAIGGQDHFYLEGHVAMALPGEGGDMTVYCSTQHPSEVQHMVAHVLGVPSHSVTVEVRRMGGGFGGKETQGNQFASIAALAARKTGRPAKCRLDRDDDMIMTGKRHEFLVDYAVGCAPDGRIRAVDMAFASRCGYSADLSGPINDRALFHADNGYFYPDVALVCLPCRTNTVSATAFRGFGGPQGMVAAERVIEEIAIRTGLDALEVRKRNLYGSGERAVTPYWMTIEDNVIERVVTECEKDADYGARRAAIQSFNAGNRWQKKGLALTPVKFGISFTNTAYNQAGALIHIYNDGSVHLNHGGTEMGQGLFIKVAQVVAEELALPLERIKITATTTGKVPNTSATAASSGSDLNGMAALAAARELKARLVAFAAEQHQLPADAVEWLPGRVRVGGDEIAFDRLVHDAYMARVQLSATGFYKTPEIHWDRATGRGKPFYYFAYGAACSEVTIDTLTGEYRVDRVDIVHDVGRSLNPAIDKGQIEGGFIQGMGWLTTEELVWDEKGRLRTHAPSTYKIPTAADRPEILNIRLLENENPKATIHRSKAVGEPPLMLAISVWQALSDAVAATAGHRHPAKLDPPATPEKVLMAIDRLAGLA
ncbi:MAG: xanthine dehydrogenase molybdopterin binding subunit [Geminicoccaceae bacterium]